MRKQLSFLMLLALMVPWTSRAQSCTPISTFPVTYGFEASEGFTSTVTAAAACTTNVFGTCWRNESTSGTASTANRIWHIYGGTSTTYKHTGSNSLILPDKGSSSAVHTTMLVFPAMNFTSANGYVVSFWIQRNGTATNNNPEGIKVYASPTDTIGPNAVLLGHYSRHRTMAYPDIVPTTGWYQYETAPITLTGTVYLIFEGQSYYSSSTYIDDVVISEAPSCNRVTDLAAPDSLITSSSITLTWTDASNTSATYDIYRLTATDTTLVQSGVSGTTYTVTGLEGSTGYTFAVMANCGGGDYAALSTPVSAYTSCMMISSLPYQNGFEDDPAYSAVPYAEAFPLCWTRINDASGTFNYYPYLSTTSTYVHSGSVGMYWYHSTTNTYASNEYAVLPPVDLTVYDVSDLTLAFYAKTTSTSYHPQPIIGVMTDPTDTSTFVAVHTFSDTALTTNWQLFAISLASYTGNGAYIAIKWPRPSALQYMAIDDIFLTDVWCDAPVSAAASATSDEVTVRWTADGGTSFTVYCGADTVINVTDTFYTFQNLTPNTLYNFGVATECGTSLSMYVEGSIRTDCMPVDSLPFVYGFEDATGASATATFNTCFGRHTNYSSAYPYPSSSYKHSGTYGLYFYRAPAYYSYLTLPTFTEDLTALQLSFWAYKSSANYGHYVVGVMSDPNDLSTFDTLVVGQPELVSTWELVEVPLSNYTGNGQYLAILAPMGTLSYLYIDDITVDYLPGCLTPTDIVATDATAHSLTVGWTSTASEFIVEYGPQGFTHGYGDSVTVYENSLNLTGLTMGTPYGVYVTAVCGDDTSNTAYGTVTTGCSVLTADDLPYSETFESYGSGATYPINACWTKGTNYSVAYPYPYTTAAINGSRGLYMYGYWPSSATGTKNYSYAVLPEIDEDLDISTLQVNFLAKRYSTVSDYYTSLVKVGIADSLSQLTGDAFAIDSAITWIDTVDLHAEAGSSVHSLEVQFSNYTGNGRYVVFFAPPVLHGSYTYNYIYLDDITLRVQPTCYFPTSIQVDSVDYDHIGLSWTPDSRTPNPSSWTVEYGPQGFTRGEGTVESVNDTTAELSYLLPDTWYDIYVSANCGDGESDPNMITVHTNCTPVPTDSLPYIEDFEAYGSGITNPISPCWTKHVMGGTTSQYPYPLSTNAPQGTRSLYYYSYSSATGYSGYAAMPAFESDLTDLMVSFQLRRYSSTTNTYHSILQVGVMTDPEDFSTFELVQEYDVTPSAPLSIHNIRLSLEGYEGNGRYIAFYGPMHPTSGHYNIFYLDSVNVDLLPSCRWPLSLAADSISHNSIHLTWTGSAGSYEVQYSTTSDFTDSTSSLVVNDTNALVTGLNEYSMYYLRVRGLCGTDTSFWSSSIAVHTHIDCGDNTVNVLDTIGHETTNSYTYPFYSYSTYPTAYSRLLFTAQELNDMGLLSNNRINSISLQTAATVQPTMNGVKIYMAETDIDEYSSTPANDTLSLLRSDMTLVFDGSLSLEANTWIEIPLSSPFQYSGSRSLVVMFARDTNVSGSSYFCYSSTAPNYRTIYGYRSATAVNNTAVRVTSRPNIAFNICTEIPQCLRPTEVTISDVVDTAATITWTGSASSYEFLLSRTSVIPDSLVNPQVISLVDDSITFDTLAPNTNYYVYVRALCGTDYSDWSIEASFRTACSPMALPYSEDFESYTSGSTYPISPCWTKGTNYSTAYPYPYSSNAITGSRSLYFYAFHSSTTQYYSYAALPLFQAPLDTLMLRFKVRRYSTTSDSYTTRLLVGVMTDPNDITTFESIDTIDLRAAVGSSIHEFELYFDQYTGNGKYIAFYDAVPPIYGTATTCYSYAYLDDIMVDYAPACRRVSSVAVDSTTTTGLYLSWAAVPGATGYQVEYGLDGFSQGFGTMATATTNSIALTGLQSSSTYNVYVRALCANGSNGDWSTPVTAYTDCGLRALPITMDFEGIPYGTTAPMPHCWTKWNNNMTSSTGYYPYVNSSASNAHSGSGYFYYYFYTTASYPSDEIFASPAIDTVNFPMNQVEVSFWAKRLTNAMSMIVGVMTDPTNGATFTAVDTIDLTTAYEEYTVSLANYTGYGNYVAFRGVHTGTTIQYIYLDDITISRISPCPRAYDLTATNATATTVALSWTDTIGSTQWVVEYGLLSDTSRTTVTANSNPFTLTGLATNSVYTYRVAPVCSNGEQADWSRESYAFATSTVPATAPYSYDFESAAEWNNWTVISNGNTRWYRGQMDSLNASNNVMYVSVDGGLTNSWNPGNIVNCIAYRDIDFGTDTHSYDLSFYYRGGGCNDGYYDGISILVVDPTIPVGEVPNTGLGTPWGNITTVYAHLDTVGDTYVVHLDNMTGVKRLVIDFYQSTTAAHTYTMMPTIIDSINVDLPACERPFNVTAIDATTNSVTLSWNGPDSALYVVDYRPAGTPNTAGLDLFDTVFGTTTHTVTGLPVASQYNFWVRRICSDSNWSYWSNYLTVATLCGVVSVADTLREDFENYTGTTYTDDTPLPTCWEGYTTGPTGHIPHITASGSYSYWISGNQGLTMTSGLSTSWGSDTYVRLIDIAEPTNSLTIAFWMCTESSTNGFLEVGYLTGPNYTTDFVPVKRINASTATMHLNNGLQDASHGIRDTVSFDSVSDGNFPICFRWNYTSSYYSVCLDDIAVWTSMVCQTPVITDVELFETSAKVTFASAATTNRVAWLPGVHTAADFANQTGNTTTDSVYTITGLTAYTTYTVGVSTTCGGDWDVATFTTLRHPCAVPTAVTVSNESYNGATVSWTAGEDENDWEVRVFCASPLYDTTYSVTDTPSLDVTGLNAGVTYSVAVRAVCASDWKSPWSDTVDLTTVTCQPVTGVGHSNLAATSVTITWTATGAASYEIEYGDVAFTTGNGTTVTSTTNSVQLTGLEDETSYDVYVRAVCAEGITSAWSERHTFTTPQATGIDDVLSGNVTLYPNPASTTVTIRGIEGESTVTVVDLNGREVYRTNADSDLTIDVRGYAKGAYFVRITGERTMAIRKLIVK